MPFTKPYLSFIKGAPWSTPPSWSPMQKNCDSGCRRLLRRTWRSIVLDPQDQRLRPSSLKILMFSMNRMMRTAHHPLSLKITKQIRRIAWYQRRPVKLAMPTMPSNHYCSNRCLTLLQDKLSLKPSQEASWNHLASFRLHSRPRLIALSSDQSKIPLSSKLQSSGKNYGSPSFWPALLDHTLVN